MSEPTIARRALEGALMLVVFLMAAEVVARVAPLAPRVQVLDERALPIEALGDVPMWTLHPDVHEALADWGCQGRSHVVLAGDSIFSLTDDEGHSVPADNLARFLRDRWPDVCFHNVSEPGHGPVQQAARAAAALERLGSAWLVFQVYKADPAFRKVGPMWYDLARYARTLSGTPQLPGVSGLLPDAFEAAAFDHSALFRRVSMAFGRVAPPRYDAYRAVLQDDDPRWQGKLFFETPNMNMAFAEQLEDRNDSVRALQADVVARGVAYVVHAETLLDTTPEALRTDPCCHVHAAGHARMAQALVPPLSAWLGAPPR